MNRVTLRSSVAVFAIALLAAGCSTSSRPSGSSTANHWGEARPLTLSRAEAAVRTRQIGRVTYSLWMGLDRGATDYQGRVVINFEMRPKAKDYSKKLFVDFSGGSLTSMNINGSGLPGEELTKTSRYDGQRIHLNVSELQTGMNRIEIAFLHPFVKSGLGLRRAVESLTDDEDEDESEAQDSDKSLEATQSHKAREREYLFTRLKPFGANRVFPCFDQPDLKASLELTVEAPNDWEVIANMPEREVGASSGHKIWLYPPSPLMSTYLFSLHAGPFQVWKGDANGIPLKLAARQGFKDQVRFKEWLELTQQGLESFSVKYGYLYPYAKYDQVIVPDLESDPIEGLAVTEFSELQSPVVSLLDHSTREWELDVLHGMSHMWLGSLVTVRWWSGLWLNEGLTLLTAYHALEEIRKDPSVWADFNRTLKNSAYLDEEAGAPVLEAPVKDVEELVTESDSDDEELYGRAAAVMRAMEHFVGEEDFDEGLQRLIQKFALRNIVPGDLVRQMYEASGKDVLGWSHAWWQNRGVNRVRANWSCALDEVKEDPDKPKKKKSQEAPVPKITEFKLTQESLTPKGIQKTHRITLGLYYFKKVRFFANDAPTDLEKVELVYSGSETLVTQLLRRPCPDFVVLNEEDRDFVVTDTDAKQWVELLKQWKRIESPASRQGLLRGEWLDVLSGRKPVEAYLELMLAWLNEEKDVSVLAGGLETLTSEHASDLTALTLVKKEEQVRWKSAFEKKLKSLLMQALAGSSRQQVLMSAFASVASSSESLDWIKKLLKGKATLRGFMPKGINQELLLRALARANDAEVGSLSKGVIPSVEVSLIDLAVKDRWLSEIFSSRSIETKVSVTDRLVAMRYFYATGQETQAAEATPRYFAAVEHIKDQLNQNNLSPDRYTLDMIAWMFPPQCTTEVGEWLEKQLRQDRWPRSVENIFRRKMQRLKWCPKIQALSSSSTGQ